VGGSTIIDKNNSRRNGGTKGSQRERTLTKRKESKEKVREN